MLVWPDFTMMHVAVIADPFQVQQILPSWQRGLPVQGVIGNAFAHGGQGAEVTSMH
jgi:hypothetical protein